ncbi:MAG: NADH pyrophosphatase [uncultured marine phage]|uniref:NADH pyrophosphatase n=1 Tax=uncultured marine phage TaxID=707152 RepID=A0A8D9FRA1_9VIRU|nr:MAG: NADH pyrophosphatase [uncultured marine phage]
MKKFTKISKNKKKKGDNVLWTNDWVKVVAFEDWTIIEGSDCVVCVPILMDENQVVLRHEYIPTYKKKDGKGYYLSIVAGTIEKGETPEECLRRELVEEAGIVLRDNFPIVFEDSLYLSKGCNSKYNICILPLYRDDFYETYAKGDGSRAEKLSKSVKVNEYNLENLKGSDVITELMLMKVRKHLNL